MTEAQFQAQVLNLARLYGWRSAHFSDSRRQIRPGVFVGDRGAAGWPDLVLVRERIVFAELKAANGRLRRGQAAWLDALKAAGAETYVWRPDDLPEIVAVFSRRAAVLPGIEEEAA